MKEEQTMDAVRIEMTVYFEDPFYVGVLERHTGGHTEAARIVFGAEPRDAEIYRLLNDRYYELRFSPSVEGGRREAAAANPKRRQRLAARRMAETGVGTKAQQALKLQQEQGKLERKTRAGQTREAEAERKFQLKQNKRKEKHRGR